MASSPAPAARNSPLYSAVRRNRTVRRGSVAVTWVRALRISDPVTARRDGLDHRRLAELGAQPADGHLDRAGERVGHLIPHPLEQVADGENASPRGEQAL